MSHLVLENVSQRLGNAQLVDQVSVDIAAASWCTIVGPNGAGKTSLLTMMAGLRRPTTGSIRIGGNDIAEMDERERARVVAFVPQSPTVPGGMSVVDYVLLGRVAYHGVLRAPRSADHEVVEGVLDRLELSDLRHRLASTLSGGEKQRMVLGRALAQSTTTILLDEPITGLDVRHQMDLMQLLANEVRDCGLCVVASLHDLSLATLFTDQLVLMDHGVVRAVGRPYDVVTSPAMSESFGVNFRVVRVDDRDLVVPHAPAPER